MSKLLRPSERDIALVRLVHRYSFLTSRHLQELLFNDYTTNLTPCLRSLQRLTRDGYIARVGHRPLGGTVGGSPFYVYRLSSRGHWLLDLATDYQRKTHAPFHALAVADIAVVVKQRQRAGLPVHSVAVEAEAYIKVADQELQPDMYIDLDHPGAGRTRLWVEMEMERHNRLELEAKMNRYINAGWYASDDERARWNPWPRVLFVGVDIERARQLRYLISRVPEEQRTLFTVTTREDLPGLLGQQT